MKAILVATTLALAASAASAGPTVTVCYKDWRLNTEAVYNWDKDRWEHCREVKRPRPRPAKPQINEDLLPLFFFLGITNLIANNNN